MLHWSPREVFLRVWDSSYHGVQTSLKLRAFPSAGVTGMHHPVLLTNILYCLFLIVYGGKLCIVYHWGELCMSVPRGGGGESCAWVCHSTHVEARCWLWLLAVRNWADEGEAVLHESAALLDAHCDQLLTTQETPEPSQSGRDMLFSANTTTPTTTSRRERLH